MGRTSVNPYYIIKYGIDCYTFSRLMNEIAKSNICSLPADINFSYDAIITGRRVIKKAGTRVGITGIELGAKMINEVPQRLDFDIRDRQK